MALATGTEVFFIKQGTMVILGGKILSTYFIGENVEYYDVRLEDGRIVSANPQELKLRHDLIRFDKGSIIVTNERGAYKLHGPFYDIAEETRFRDMWHGKLGLTIISRIDLAQNPIIAAEGAGLEGLLT